MSKYQNSKIYRIVSNATDKVYIGSTYQALSSRMSGHRKEFKRYMNGLVTAFCTSYSILEYGDAEIILIENCPCETKEELRARERFHIENNNCVNKNIPGRGKKEYLREYYGKNKEIMNAKQREYYEKNKETISTKQREYHEENKEIINAKHREYYEKNKEVISEIRNEKIVCEFCGCEVRKYNLKRHQRSKKCLTHQ
tara:strand:- start:1318 stop:1911 length:594 start_codon:yes stop_codon:yes gene_type:complete